MIGTPGLNLTRSLRLIVGAIGGYVFAAGVVAVVGVVLPALGMAASESATLGGMLGFLVYPAIIIWAAASSRPVRMALVVFLGAAMMITVAPMMVQG